MNNILKLARAYPLKIEPVPPSDGSGYYAYSNAFPGILGDGETPERAAEDVIEVLADVIDRRIKTGMQLPAM